MKIKELAYFTDSIMKIKEIERKIGSAVHAKSVICGWVA
jgi:hypothetical protein